ncbi:nickel pincer cofactor biosynthesis protein LarC [Caldanaerobius polysaccharolyticus]|uniref:nickel pincer cofactor biosynthesis protein LarC n=1 Tax=Caldanaerobius polysaccharolyticus TaxID=44256 RepID=UPI00047CC4A3|nr:nickel pincer cofactor biosynthesis protein LarC [Caldanaerobius polysaccharolyticus]
MKVLYFDCFAGISGDMTISSLLDLGLDVEEFHRQLKSLDIGGYALDIGRTSKNGITAMYFKVQLHGDEDDHGQHVHRNFSQIKELIGNSGLDDEVKNTAIRIFENLALAEAKVHGRPPEEVHFHEVGAVDSIVDIVGTAIAINMLKPDVIWCSPLPVGGGMAHSMHGIIPIPAPATMEILKGVPVYDNGVKKELVTPTGAAIVKTLASRFGDMPPMAVERVGYGAGTRDMDIPNLLRVIYGELQDKKKPTI